MQRTLDFSLVWNEAVALLRQHRELIIAIAGLLIFVPNWASSFLTGQPDVEGLTDASAILQKQLQHISDNSHIIIPFGLVSILGSIAILSLFLRRDLARVSDILLFAVKLFPVFLLASMLAGLFKFFGLFAFFIGLFYLMGRLAPVGSIVVAEKEYGIGGSITRAWELTRGLGWKSFLLFLIVFIVGVISMNVVNVVTGLLCRLIAGPDGISLVETFVAGLAATLYTVILLALQAALFNHLAAQDEALVPQG
jgi:hypothetical protein